MIYKTIPTLTYYKIIFILCISLLRLKYKHSQSGVDVLLSSDKILEVDVLASLEITQNQRVILYIFLIERLQFKQANFFHLQVLGSGAYRICFVKDQNST